MKTTPLLLGIASDATNTQMISNLFSRYYDIDLSNSMNDGNILIGENPVRIIILWVDELTQRIMSWDVCLGIAGLWQFIKSFKKQWKIPLQEMTQFGYRDEKYRAIVPVYKIVGDGRWENWFDDANKFWFRKASEVEEVIWRSVPLYEVSFSIDDRWIQDEVSDVDFPVGVTSLRTIKKQSDVRSMISDLREKAGLLYETSSYYRQKYPRG